MARVSIEADDFLGRVFQHEVDHLDGVLMVERLDDDMRKQALRVLRDRAMGLDTSAMEAKLVRPGSPASRGFGRRRRGPTSRLARLVFLGTPDAAVAPLRTLVASGHDVALVVTRPDKRRGRGGPRSRARSRTPLSTRLTVTDSLADAIASGRSSA